MAKEVLVTPMRGRRSIIKHCSDELLFPCQGHRCPRLHAQQERVATILMALRSCQFPSEGARDPIGPVQAFSLSAGLCGGPNVLGYYESIE